MSTYLYVTAERKTAVGWRLYAPMKYDPDWDADLTPPLIVDGGWPAMARAVIDKVENWGLPEDASPELRTFHGQCLAKECDGCIGWGMYSAMKAIKTDESSLGGSKNFGSLFSDIPDRGNLRLVYWWSH